MITETLQAIQSELKAPKSQFNSFGKYNYRSCEDILEALKPILAKHKAAVTLSDTIEQIGTRIYVKATAVLSVNGENEAVTAYAREDESKKGMDGCQVTGSASSYARKYALNGLFAIDDTKDSDTQNDGRQDNPPKSNAKIQATSPTPVNDEIKVLQERIAQRKQELHQLTHLTNDYIVNTAMHNANISKPQTVGDWQAIDRCLSQWIANERTKQ